MSAKATSFDYETGRAHEALTYEEPVPVQPATHYASSGASKLWCEAPFAGAKTTNERARVTCRACLEAVPWRLVRISQERGYR